MEKTHTLVVEGPDDQKFLSDFIRFKFGDKIHSNVAFFRNGNHADGLKAKETSIRERVLQTRVGIILDGDLQNFENTKKITLDFASQVGINHKDVFLFPDDETFGRLETLLRKIIPENNQHIINCIDAYKKCISPLKDLNLKKFDHHNEIFVYVGSLEQAGNPKGEFREYNKPHVWDLSHHELGPLLKFLQSFFA